MTNSRKELSFSGHTHSGYAATNHTHSQYALNNHTHTEYSTIGHTHPQYVTENDVIELINTRPPAAPSLTLELGISDLTRKMSGSNTYYEYDKNLVSLTGFTPVSVTIYSSFTMNLTAKYTGENASYLTALNKTYDFSISGSDYTLLPGDETYDICNKYDNTMKVPDIQYQYNRKARVVSTINFIFNTNYNLTFGFKSGFQYVHDGGYSGSWKPTSVHLNTTSINSFYCKLLILGERSN